MLYIVGIGLKPMHLTLEAKFALENCTEIYFEDYTSKYSEGTVDDLEKMLDRNFLRLERGELEEGFERQILDSREKDIALLVLGNPLSATTHTQLLLDAKKAGAEVKVIPGISIFSFLGFTGLQEYKFGRTVTIVAPKPNYSPDSFFDSIIQNKKAGLHTLCLLDIDEDGGMLSIKNALGILSDIAKKRKKPGALSKMVFVGVAGAGSDSQEIKAGAMKELESWEPAPFPQSLVVCGSLSEKEGEFLREIRDMKSGSMQ